jgi:hypothetical protein
MPNSTRQLTVRTGSGMAPYSWTGSLSFELWIVRFSHGARCWSTRPSNLSIMMMQAQLSIAQMDPRTEEMSLSDATV